MKRVIKWGNLVNAFLFVGSLLVVLHDLYMVTISELFTGYLVGFTWFGLGTFIAAIVILISSSNELKKELARTSSNK